MLPTPCISEVAYFLALRATVREESRFLRSLASGGIYIEEPELSDYARAANLVEQYAGFPLGTVDALVAATAERLRSTTILTLDRRHFGALKPCHCESFTLVP